MNSIRQFTQNLNIYRTICFLMSHSWKIWGSVYTWRAWRGVNFQLIKYYQWLPLRCVRRAGVSDLPLSLRNRGPSMRQKCRGQEWPALHHWFIWYSLKEPLNNSSALGSKCTPLIFKYSQGDVMHRLDWKCTHLKTKLFPTLTDYKIL